MEEKEEVFDGILEEVGSRGKFQTRFSYIYNFAVCICASMVFMNILLALSKPKHWCHVPGRNDTNYTLDEWKNLTLPREINNKHKEAPSSCHMYSISTGHNETTSCIFGYEYDREYFEETIVTQENWVCDREISSMHAVSFNRIADVIGTLAAGHIGDTLGRRWLFYMSLIIVVTGKVLTTVSSWNFTLFAFVIMLGSITSTPVFQSTLVLGMEVSKKQDRGKITMLQCIGWTLGICTLPLVFAATKHWKIFLVITSVPGLFVFLYPKYMIESPRWLANKGKYAECLVQLKKIARINGKKFEMTEDMLRCRLTKEQKKTEYGLKSLFSGIRLIKNTLCIFMAWSTALISYFVLLLNATNMDGNPFLNFFLITAIEVPAFACGKICADKIGRRFTQVLAFIGATITLLIQISIVTLPDNELYVTITTLSIKFCIAIIFFIVQLQTMEIYPTCLRQTGISVSSTVANAIGAVGPYIVFIGTTIDVRYPWMILGTCCFICIFTGLFLPETLHQTLPESIEDAKDFGIDQKFWSFPKKPIKYSAVSKDNFIDDKL